MGQITRDLAMQDFTRRQDEEREERDRKIVTLLLVETGHDPDELVSDAGHSVLDLWMGRVAEQIPS